MLNQIYKPYEDYLRQTLSGEGMVGKIVIIEELNDLYETREFLSDVTLIGSDGGDTAYGVEIEGRYIEVSFIGMDDGEIKIIEIILMNLSIMFGVNNRFSEEVTFI